MNDFIYLFLCVYIYIDGLEQDCSKSPVTGEFPAQMASNEENVSV